MQNRGSKDQVFQFLESLIFLFERNEISKDRINRKADFGSPWQAPQCKEK